MSCLYILEIKPLSVPAVCILACPSGDSDAIWNSRTAAPEKDDGPGRCFPSCTVDFLFMQLLAPSPKDAEGLVLSSVAFQPTQEPSESTRSRGDPEPEFPPP